MKDNRRVVSADQNKLEEVMTYEVTPDEKFPNEWRCEAIDQKTGDIYVAVFAGPDAEERARDYASWQQSLARAA